MNCLALDPGTHTGWAAQIDGRIESGVQAFDLERGESPGMRFIRFNRFLAEMLAMVKPEIVCFEKAFLMPSAHASEIHYGMSTRIMEACSSLGIEHQSINAMKLKKWATGYGRASKAMMLDAVRSRWITTIGPHTCQVLKCFDPVHDECDALALLHYTLAELGK